MPTKLKRLSPSDHHVLELLRSRPLTSLTDRQSAIARRLQRRGFIERFSVTVNPAIYDLLRCGRKSYLMLIDPMLLPAERRIAHYFESTPFRDRITLYATFGEFAFAALFVGTPDEMQRLAEDVRGAVHAGEGGIPPDDRCNLQQGLCLYEMQRAIRLGGEMLRRPPNDVKPRLSQIAELARAVDDASGFASGNRTLAYFRRKGLVGPFTVHYDPAKLGRLAVIVPLFYYTERELREDLLVSRTLKEGIRDAYEVVPFGTWGRDEYRRVTFVLWCEFAGLYPEYDQWYRKVLERAKSANLNEFAVRARPSLTEVPPPVSDIPRIVEAARRYSGPTGSVLVLGAPVAHDAPIPKLQAGLPRASLNRHVFVVGRPRTGKSTTIERIVSEARRLGMKAFVLDGKGELVDDHGTLLSVAMSRLGAQHYDVFDASPLTAVLEGSRPVLGVLSVRGLEKEKYPSALYSLLSAVDACRTTSKPGSPGQINAIVVIDELETLVQGQAAAITGLARSLTQAASKGVCLVPVLHGLATEYRTVLDRCENRIVHAVGEGDGNRIAELLVPSTTQVRERERLAEEVVGLAPGEALVSFLAPGGQRLPPLKILIGQLGNRR